MHDKRAAARAKLHDSAVLSRQRELSEGLDAFMAVVPGQLKPSALNLQLARFEAFLVAKALKIQRGFLGHATRELGGSDTEDAFLSQQAEQRMLAELGVTRASAESAVVIAEGNLKRELLQRLSKKPSECDGILGLLGIGPQPEDDEGEAAAGSSSFRPAPASLAENADAFAEVANRTCDGIETCRKMVLSHLLP